MAAKLACALALGAQLVLSAGLGILRLEVSADSITVDLKKLVQLASGLEAVALQVEIRSPKGCGELLSLAFGELLPVGGVGIPWQPF